MVRRTRFLGTAIAVVVVLSIVWLVEAAGVSDYPSSYLVDESFRLRKLRESVLTYKAVHGKFPESLADLNAPPGLIYSPIRGSTVTMLSDSSNQSIVLELRYTLQQHRVLGLNRARTVEVLMVAGTQEQSVRMFTRILTQN
ncbi:MAG: hypothetical protein ABL949_12130 [Fimbriimonadaceae bacterium]